MGCCHGGEVPAPNPQSSRGFAASARQFVVYRDRDLRKDYEVVRVLAQNAFGHVYLVKNKATGLQRAAKEITSKVSKAERESFLTSVSDLASIDHPNILRLLEVYSDSQKTAVVSELQTGPELVEYLKSAPQALTEPMASKIMLQLLSAVCTYHRHGVFHRGLTMENLMLEREVAVNETPTIIIIDFGTVDFKGKAEQSKVAAGSRYYTAPETLQGRCSSATDIWSLGVILYILLSGNPPFTGPNDEEIQRKILSFDYDLEQGVWPKVSEPVKSLIRCMMRPESERITAEEALGHEWLTRNQKTEFDEELTAGEALANFRRFGGQMKLRHILSAFVVAHFASLEEIETYRANFQLLDKDHSGMLTRSELISGLSMTMSEEEAETQVEALLKTVDLNQTETVDYSEFLTAAAFAKRKVAIETLKDAFDSLDADKSGKISAKELRSLLNSEGGSMENLDRLIAQADIDSDGEISLSEFIPFLLNER